MSTSYSCFVRTSSIMISYIGFLIIFFVFTTLFVILPQCYVTLKKFIQNFILMLRNHKLKKIHTFIFFYYNLIIIQIK